MMLTLRSCQVRGRLGEGEPALHARGSSFFSRIGERETSPRKNGDLEASRHSGGARPIDFEKRRGREVLRELTLRNYIQISDAGASRRVDVLVPNLDAVDISSWVLLG